MTEHNIGRIPDGSGEFGEYADKKHVDSPKEGLTPGPEKRVLFIGNSLGSSAEPARVFEAATAPVDLPQIRVSTNDAIVIPERDSWPILSSRLRRKANHEIRFSTIRQGTTSFDREKSEQIDPDLKAKLAQEYPDFPERVINRAATNPDWYAHVMLRNYRTVTERVTMLSADEENKDIPQDILIKAAFEGKTPQQVIETREYIMRKAMMREVAEKKGFQVEGVPALKQRHINWCGYTSLSMVLQYKGYADLTPEKLFRHEFGEYDGVLESVDPRQGPYIETLALITKELTPLTPRVLGEKEYNIVRKKDSYFERPRDLLKGFLEGKNPCIIRLPRHFIVVTGYDQESDRYTVNNPFQGYETTMRAATLESAWGSTEDYYRDSRNLMLVINKPRGERMEGAKNNAA